MAVRAHQYQISSPGVGLTRHMEGYYVVTFDVPFAAHTVDRFEVELANLTEHTVMVT